MNSAENLLAAVGTFLKPNASKCLESTSVLYMIPSRFHISRAVIHFISTFGERARGNNWWTSDQVLSALQNTRNSFIRLQTFQQHRTQRVKMTILLSTERALQATRNNDDDDDAD